MYEEASKNSPATYPMHLYMSWVMGTEQWALYKRSLHDPGPRPGQTYRFNANIFHTINRFACSLSACVWTCAELGTWEVIFNFLYYSEKWLFFQSHSVNLTGGGCYFSRPGPENSLFLSHEVGLEITFGTALHNRKPQMPSSGCVPVARIFNVH